MASAAASPLFCDDCMAELPAGEAAPVRPGRYRAQALVGLVVTSALMWTGIIALIVHFAR